jgi:hypothetical protein
MSSSLHSRGYLSSRDAPYNVERATAAIPL